MVKNKYYVWLLWGIFCLLSGQLLLDMLSAILLAIIEVKYLSGDLLKLKPETIRKFEDSFVFRKIKGRSDFILFGSNILNNENE